MNEIKVDRILPEHVGMEIFFPKQNSWGSITAVGIELFLVMTNNGEGWEYRFPKKSPWTIRSPKQKEEKPKLSSERINEIYSGMTLAPVLMNKSPDLEYCLKKVLSIERYLDEVLPPLLEKLK